MSTRTTLTPRPSRVVERVEVPERLVRLTQVAQCLRDRGLPEEVIQDLVTATEPNLITLEEASEKYTLRPDRIRMWIRRGHLEEGGRQRFHAPGGGKILVNEDDIAHLCANPPKDGRPPKDKKVA